MFQRRRPVRTSRHHYLTEFPQVFHNCSQTIGSLAPLEVGIDRKRSPMRRITPAVSLQLTPLYKHRVLGTLRTESGHS